MDSYDLQRFLDQYRDLMAWLSSMQALVSADELANDVGGAERLLERHQVSRAENRPILRLYLACWFKFTQEHYTEIDARESGFHSLEASGQQLLASRHFASSEIQEKLDALRTERGTLQR